MGSWPQAAVERTVEISGPALGSTAKYRSRLMIVLSLASCILSVSLAKSEARYRGYSGFRRNYSPGYFRGYSSSYGRSDYHHKVQQHHQQHQHSGLRKYGYKIVSPPAPHMEAEKDRFIPAPVKPRIVSPSFDIDIDLASEQQVPSVPSNKIDIEQNIPLPTPTFPPRILKPQPITNPISIPAPVPAVPAVTPQLPAVPAVTPQLPAVPAVTPQLSAIPAVTPQLSAVPAVVRADLPLLPQAIPAVPGRPILADSSQSESAGNIFVPMPVPAVPGL